MANIISRAFTSLRQYIGGFRLSNTRLWGVGEPEVYTPIETEVAVQKGYNANAAVYSITNKYAKKAASIEHYLENIADETILEKHPLQLLISQPNASQSEYSFFRDVYSQRKVCGEVFIWLNRGDVTQMVNEAGELLDRSIREIMMQPILEMYVIPSNQITVLSSPDSPFVASGYQLRNNPAIKFGLADMIHVKSTNMEWDDLGRPQLRGMSPLKPGYKTLTADNSLVDSMVRMAQNDGAKGVLINKTIGATMSPKQQTQVDMVIQDKVNNKEIKNTVAALEGDWDYKDIGLTSVDMATLEAREFIYKEMCFLLDVPYGFFDSHTPYAEKQLAARDWISNSIKPDVREMDSELARYLLPAFGLAKVSEEGRLLSATAKLCSDFDGLPEMQEDKAKMMEWLNKAPLTGNQRLDALEYEPSTDPAMEIVTSSDLMYPMDKAEQDMQAPDPTNDNAYSQ